MVFCIGILVDFEIFVLCFDLWQMVVSVYIDRIASNLFPEMRFVKRGRSLCLDIFVCVT